MLHLTMGRTHSFERHEAEFRLFQLFATILFPSLAAAVPTLALPVNSQVPPVARVSKLYQFVFAASTFSTNSSGLQYAVEGAPTWLQLDSPNRAFSGTPGVRDLGPAAFNLTASDDSGSTSDTVTFVVSDNPGPGLGKSIAQQLTAFGSTSDQDTLLLYPASPLSLQFGFDTFTNTDSTTEYYALCAYNTPLPSWMYFNPVDLSFSGTTPSFNSPDELSQEFDVHLSASDVAGFSAAVATFHVIIGLHELTFGSQQFVINATSEQSIEYNGLRNALTLDGSAFKSEDLKKVTFGGPKWLSLDHTSLEISGIAPGNLGPQAFVVTVEDVYNDVANTTVYLSTGSSSTLTIGNIPPLRVLIGKHLSYTFSQSLFTLPNVSVEVDLGNASSWLQFNPDSLTLSGIVPSDLLPQTDALNLTASHGSDTVSTAVNLDIVAGEGSSNPSSTLQSSPSSTSSAGGPTSSTTSSNANSNLTSDAQKVAAAVILPIVGVLALVFCIWLLRRRRRLSVAGGEKRSLLRRFRPPEMIIGAPEDFGRSTTQARPASRHWSLPRLDLHVPTFTIPLDRNRHSQLISPERMPRARSHNSIHGMTEDSVLISSSPDHKSPPASTPASRRPQMQANSLSRVRHGTSKILPQSPRAISRPRRIMRRYTGSANGLHPIHGLGHGHAAPIPCVVQDSVIIQRCSKFNSRTGSRMDMLSMYDRNKNMQKRGDARENGLLDIERQPSDATNTADSNWTTSEESAEVHNGATGVLLRRAPPGSRFNRDDHGETTVRLVSTPSPDAGNDIGQQSTSTSPMTKREKYLRERRQMHKESTLLSSKSLQHLSSWTYDLNPEDRQSGSRFSTIPRGSLSAQRKGQMMQNGAGSSASTNHGILNRFQSANSLRGDPRFEDPEETDFSGNTESIWEDDKPNEYGEKVWRKTDEASSNASGAQSSRRSKRRLSWLMGQHRERTENRELTLGTAGKRPVSVESGTAGGLSGSKSFKGSVAFL